MSSAIRMPWTLKSVPARLTFWYLCTLGASLAAFAVFVFLVRATTLYRELDAELELSAHQLERELRGALLSVDVAAALAADPRARRAPLLVRELPDYVLFRGPAFPQLDWRGERRLADAVRQASPLVTVEDRARGAYRVATVIVPRPGTGPLALQVARSTAPAEQSLGQLAGAMLLAILAVLAVASYGSSFTARRALAPIDAIVARVREIQAHRLSERLDIHAGSDELDRLVVTLNEMLDRIEASMETTRRFAADASHELQTPIAAMRAIVETCLRSEDDGASFRDMAADLLAEIERLSQLIRDLQLFALARGGHLLARTDPVDLAAIALECCEIARAVAEEREIRVDARIEARPLVLGSALHLRRVVLNLTDNAIRYSPPGASVVVSLTHADGYAVLSVADRGCGIAPDDLPHIFEPFYRADPARARATGGTGLGLAIADQVVRAHGGHIRVESVPGVGSTFTVLLPLARAAGATAD